ncbi:MAG: 5'-nucleotidase [Clostridiales bacterium]|nr:5'-nucleotidase [Clostridiales bacterium]MDY2835864.1 5'-nucleotidase [Candidatus Aphodomonas sp.]
MAYDLSEPLVIGISSRALFNLEQENKIFEEQGLSEYEAYQVQHEKDVLAKGSAFQLVRAFLNLNTLQEKRLVEVIVMSRNSPNTSLRIFNSIAHYGLDITRAALTGGAEIAPYLKAFRTDLFLSANQDDVKQAVDGGVAAATILPGSPHDNPDSAVNQIHIAFDGDAVLFAAEAERIYRHEGIDAFQENEREKADIPLERGPFANFLTAVAHIQSLFPSKEAAPIRTALVTSRNAPAHERAVKTLRYWGVRVDEAFFLGGVSKKDVLSAFGAHIFFDDQHIHAGPASEVVPAAVVPYREGDDPRV